MTSNTYASARPTSRLDRLNRLDREHGLTLLYILADRITNPCEGWQAVTDVATLDRLIDRQLDRQLAAQQAVTR